MSLKPPLFLFSFWVVACTSPVADEACRPFPLPTDPEERLAFSGPSCYPSTGSGVFGLWRADERGLPAYEYTLRHELDAAALYANSENAERRLHWSGFGNDRFTALAYNTGAFEVLSPERGILSLNLASPDQGRWGGGIGIVRDDTGKTLSTLAWNNTAVRRRMFHVDGGSTIAEQNGIQIIHRTWSVFGDAPLVRNEAVLVNQSSIPRSLVYLETWDVALEQRFVGLVGPGLRKLRQSFNKNFAVEAIWDAATGVALARFPPYATQPSGPSEKNFLYPEVFLAPVDRKPSDGYVSRDTVGFKADGKPHLRLDKPVRTLRLASAEASPLALTLRWNVTLPPGESITLGSTFGYRYPTDPPLTELHAVARNSRWKPNGTAYREAGVFLESEMARWIGRETEWHAAMLQANSMYDAFHRAHVYNQGSTYGYLQGGGGAPRDEVLALLPAIYVRPDLAKENLRFIMRTTDPNGRIYYAFTGYGALTGAVIHENPSDLDIFFLWGLSEYLLATRDFSFLNERVPYYQSPGTAQESVLDHARKALQHLTTTIGFGAHGLLALRQGDWSDGITLRAKDRSLAERFGESTLNAAMAAYVMPRLAAAIEQADPVLAQAAESLGQQQAEAFDKTWQGRWYLRGYGDVNEPIGVGQLFLEPQAFALLAGIVSPDRRETLLAAIAEILEDPSPIGQVIVFPPDEGNPFLEPGWDVNGGSWHAMNGVLTLAYLGLDAKRAWQSVEKNSLHRHAQAYPRLWYGIWSGPDSFNAWYAKRPGETFQHIATPMTDFPVMNSNQHALPLLTALRGYGMAATSAGLAVDPVFAEKPFVMRASWFRIAGGPNNLAVEIMALYPGARWVSLRKPIGSTGRVSVLHGSVTATVDAGNQIHLLWVPTEREVLKARIE